ATQPSRTTTVRDGGGWWRLGRESEACSPPGPTARARAERPPPSPTVLHQPPQPSCFAPLRDRRPDEVAPFGPRAVVVLHLLDAGTPGADRGVHLLRNRIARRADARAVGHQRPTLGYPFRPPAVHQLGVRVTVQLQQPKRERGEPVVIVAVQNHGRLRCHTRLREQRGERLLVRDITPDRVVQLRL